MIVAEHLRKTFPGKGRKAAPVIAVDDVSFTAHDGQITGLLGPNGAGKTTTMRMLYTLMQPEAGRVLVDGIDVGQDAKAVRRSLGVLPDARGVYKRLTARENIAYFGELHGMSAAHIRERTKVLSKALDMEDILDRQTDGFSQGQRTKTAIARALVHDPKLVLMDEPFGALDALTREKMNLELLHIWQKARKTILFVTHGITEAVFLGTRVVVFTAGPARMADFFPIDLAAPRRLHVKTSPEFGGYVRRVYDLLGVE